MKVYILLITRHGCGFLYDTYIDSVYSSEENAWRRIEEKLYSYIEIVKKSDYKVSRIEFRNKELIFEYENFIEDLYGSIRYEIHEQVVK